MRLVAAASTALLLAAGVLLAGCTQNSPNGEDGGAFGSCPSWVKGLSQERVVWSVNFLFTNQSTSAPALDDWDLREPTFDAQGNLAKPGAGFGEGFQEFQGAPLDQVVFDFVRRGSGDKQTGLFVLDAEVHLTFLASYDGAPGETLSAYDQSKGPSSGKPEWVFRSDDADGDWFNITLRVDLAGIDQQPDPRGIFVYWTWVFDLDDNVDTPSAVARGYSPEFWYRTCSADGTRFGNR